MNKEEILFTECSNLDEKFTFFTVIVQYSTNNNSRWSAVLCTLIRRRLHDRQLLDSCKIM